MRLFARSWRAVAQSGPLQPRSVAALTRAEVATNFGRSGYGSGSRVFVPSIRGPSWGCLGHGCRGVKPGRSPRQDSVHELTIPSVDEGQSSPDSPRTVPASLVNGQDHRVLRGRGRPVVLLTACSEEANPAGQSGGDPRRVHVSRPLRKIGRGAKRSLKLC